MTNNMKQSISINGTSTSRTRDLAESTPRRNIYNNSANQWWKTFAGPNASDAVLPNWVRISTAGKGNHTKVNCYEARSSIDGPWRGFSTFTKAVEYAGATMVQSPLCQRMIPRGRNEVGTLVRWLKIEHASEFQRLKELAGGYIKELYVYENCLSLKRLYRHHSIPGRTFDTEEQLISAFRDKSVLHPNFKERRNGTVFFNQEHTPKKSTISSTKPSAPQKNCPKNLFSYLNESSDDELVVQDLSTKMDDVVEKKNSTVITTLSDGEEWIECKKRKPKKKLVEIKKSDESTKLGEKSVKKPAKKPVEKKKPDENKKPVETSWWKKKCDLEKAKREDKAEKEHMKAMAEAEEQIIEEKAKVEEEQRMEEQAKADEQKRLDAQFDGMTLLPAKEKIYKPKTGSKKSSKGKKINPADIGFRY